VNTAETVEEVLHKLRNVVAPLAQRWHLDHDDGDPIVQVGPEGAVRDSLAQVLVARP